MKAAIMGAGAMGTVLGAFLTRNGFPVDLIDSYPAQVDALNEKGAGVVGCAELTVPVRALLPEQMEGVYDLVFLMVKQTNNEASLRALLPHLGENSTVCTLQNGVPELAVAEFVGRNRTVGGACRWGATFVEPGISELTGATVTCTLIGERPGLITAESMSAYIAYKATVGMPEARRTVVSNIHRAGTIPAEAGAHIAEIIKIMLDKKASGTDLKL